MRLAIQATPGLGIATIATAALALWPRAQPSAPPLPDPAPEEIVVPVAQTQPMDPCAGARGLVLSGRVTGGWSHVRLAGPVIYSDVTTDGDGRFELRIPISSDDVCTLLPAPVTYRFADDAMTLEYRISFER